MSAITDKPDKSSLSVTIEEPPEEDGLTDEEREAFFAGFAYADKDSVITPWKALKIWIRERDEKS